MQEKQQGDGKISDFIQYLCNKATAGLYCCQHHDAKQGQGISVWFIYDNFLIFKISQALIPVEEVDDG